MTVPGRKEKCPPNVNTCQKFIGSKFGSFFYILKPKWSQIFVLPYRNWWKIYSNSHVRNAKRNGIIWRWLPAKNISIKRWTTTWWYFLWVRKWWMQWIQQNSPLRQSIFSAYVFDVYSQTDFEQNNHI